MRKNKIERKKGLNFFSYEQNLHVVLNKKIFKNIYSSKLYSFIITMLYLKVDHKITQKVTDALKATSQHG